MLVVHRRSCRKSRQYDVDSESDDRGPLSGNSWRLREYRRLGTWLKGKRRGDTGFVWCLWPRPWPFIGGYGGGWSCQPDRRHLVWWPKSYSRYGYRSGLDRFKRKGAIFLVVPLVILQRLITLLAQWSHRHDSSSPFESVPSWLSLILCVKGSIRASESRS